MMEQQKIESGDVTLESLLTRQNYLFRVSNYQRHYVWEEKEVRQFLSDGEFCWKQEMEGKRFIHFAGLISLRTMERERDSLTKVEIVDGQQRLSTFLLLVAIASRMISQEFGEKALGEELRKKYFKAQTDFRKAEERFLLSRRDQDFWLQITCEKEKKELNAATESQKHMKKAVQVIEDYLREQIIKGESGEGVAKVLIKYVEDLASSFRLVTLTTTHPGYAYALYQTINDRGVPLTSGELLKARTIELLSDQEDMAREAEVIWDDILEDAGKDTDNYLSWNYAAVTGRQIGGGKSLTIHEQYERDIFRCYGKRILSEAEQQAMKRQLDVLRTNVIRMRRLTRGILPDKCSEYAAVLYEALIKILKNTVSIPLYLKILDMEGKNKERTIDQVTPMLAKAFFVAKTMGGLHNTVIVNTYLEIWQYIDKNRADIDKIRACLEKLMQRENCIQEFETRIKDNIYVRGTANGKAKFLLLMLELFYLKKMERGKGDFGDDSMKICVDNISVEHILSESTDPNEVSRAFYEGIHKIGNLTILGKKPNGRRKNDSFEDKREFYQISPYYLTREVGKLEHWRKENFDERQEKLTQALSDAFKL